MASVSRFLTKKLRLTVNETKSAVARPEERKFLGFSISNDGSERRIAPKALDKFKTQIRDMTRRTRGISLPQLIEDLTPYLIREPKVGPAVHPSEPTMGPDWDRAPRSGSRAGPATKNRKHREPHASPCRRERTTADPRCPADCRAGARCGIRASA